MTSEGTITLYDHSDKVLDKKHYSLERRIGKIIGLWKKDFPDAAYVQISPDISVFLSPLQLELKPERPKGVYSNKSPMGIADELKKS